MRVYLISGLGADSRAFSQLRFPGNIDPVFLEWIEPLDEEDLTSYSRRLAQGIDVSQPFSLIGLSMGGMVAIEMSKFLKPEKVIIISSVPSNACFPKRLKFAGKLKAFQLIPVSWLKSGSMVKRIFFGETPAAKKLIKDMIRDSDPRFIKWALKAISLWQNSSVPPSLIHIHGEKDEIFPIRYCKPDFVISGGAHLMIVTQAKEISKILAGVLG